MNVANPHFVHDPYTIPLEDIDLSDPHIFQQDAHWGYFERLRREDPVHYCRDSQFGPFWSVTKYNDIMQVERNHQGLFLRRRHHARGAGHRS